MNYPFRIPATPLSERPKQFLAACDEGAWLPAARLLRDHLAAKGDILSMGGFAAAVVQFVQQAPECALHHSGLPQAGNAEAGWWRGRLLGHLIGGHLTRARLAASRSDYRAAHYHLGSAIGIRARVTAHEVMMVGQLTEIAIMLGKIEAALVVGRPELVEGVGLAAPHPSDLAQPNGYHPAFLADLLYLAVGCGASDAFLELVLRVCFTHCTWPSWRALSDLLGEEQIVVRQTAAVLLRSNMRFGPGAAPHLDRLVGGGGFRHEPRRSASDDVDF